MTAITLKDGARPALGDGVTLSETSLALAELGTSSTMEKTYTVVLNTDPTADVTITVANGDATAVAVDTNAGTSGDQNTMTFTAGGDGSGSGGGNGNWAVAQTVTVRALNDADVTNESFNLTHNATAASGAYNGISINNVAVTTADAGHGVVVSESSLSVAENDETATYTVVLKSQPSGAVEIRNTLPGSATLSPVTLTFTNSNWNAPQTVTVTGKEAGSQRISVIITATADPTNYSTELPIDSVKVTVTDTTTLVITETNTTTTVSEDGTTTDTYTAALSTQPTQDVTVTVTSVDTAAATVNPGTLTFTSANYGTAQTVTVTGVDDHIDNPGDARTVTISHATSSADADHNDNSAGKVTVTVTNDDEAGVALDPTSLSLTELGDTSTMEKTYTVVLETDPTADVTITVANGDTTAVEVDTDADTTGNQNTLTFTAGGDGSGSGGGNGNWATAQTVTVRALNDPDAAAESFNLTHTASATGSTAPYDGITINSVAITTTDAGHGVVVSETSFSLLDSDEEATYTVALKSEPSGDVEISTTSGATGIATVSPATLTFTDSDWSTPQTVTVTGKGAGSTAISHEVSTTADTTNYPTSTTISPVAITVTADTRLTVNLENPGNTGTYGFYTVNEGETGQIHVILSGALGADVEIPVTLSGFARGTAEDYTEPNPSSVTIPAGQTRATLSIVTTDDNLVEGHEGVGIRIDTDHLPGTVRAGTTVANGFYIIDNDGLVPSIGTMALKELGGPGEVEKTYTIVLKTDPADANITVTVRSNKEAAARVKIGSGPFGRQATFTFTPGNSGNWNTDQTVTVQAVNDGDGDDERFGISHQLTVSGSDENHPYLGARSGNVVVTITDAGHGVVVSETSFSLLDSDEEATYTVALKSQPSGAVEISATSGVTGTATVSPATLTFTDSDWNTPQTVTVTGKGAGSTSISHEVSTTADTTNYPTSTTISPVAITVTADTRRTVNLENPGNTGTYGVYTVNEGETGQIHVILSGALGADVEIPVTLSGFARGTAEDYTEPNPSSVTIPAGQTRATLSIVTTDDNLVEGHEGVGIRIDTDHLPGTVRAGTTVANGFYIIDNDGLVPSIGTMALKELGGPGEVEKTYTIVLKTDPADANITVMVSSNKEAAARVKIGSGPFGRQATFTFTPGNSGNWNTDQTVTVQAVNDGDGDDERFGISHQLTVSGSDENHPYLGARSGNVVVTITDAGHGVVVSETSFSLLDSDEEGTYTVALKSQPSGAVEISATSGVTGTATVSPATLTFTDSDWNTPQTVTVTGKGAGSTAISHEVSTTADTTNYPTSTTISPVAITVTADNRPTVNLENPGNTGGFAVYAVNEGEAAQIKVTLSGALGADVEIPVTLSGVARGTAEDYTEPNPSSVTIPAGQTSATLSIVTTDDNLVEGYEGVTVRIDTDHLPGTVRAGTIVGDTFYIIDNDGLLPSIGTMALTELGGPSEVEKTYSIVLKTDPADANIIVTVRSNKEAAQVKIGSGPFGRQATFTFTPGDSGNWNTAQTVTVRALNDGDGDSEVGRISHQLTVSGSDENHPYLGARSGNVVVTITDAGHGVVVSEASLSLLDNDEEATYTVVLKSQPSGDVAISATSGVTGTATVSPATLTFTNSTWDDPQTVTVTGKGAGSTSISHAVSTTADATNYPTSTTIPPVAVTVTAVAPSAGLTITETDGDTTVSEDGTTLTDTYTIALNTEPTHDVTVTVTAGAEAQVNKTGGTAGPEQTLTFTPSGAGIWSAAQTITVTGVDDNIDNTGDERTVSISHGATSSDPNYIITNAGTVSVTVTDDDTDGVTVSETTRTVSEDGGTATYTVALDTEPLSNVTITVTSDDDTMVKLDGPDNATAYTDTEDLVFAPSNWNTPQTVTIQGQNDNIFNSRTRTATITHKITAEGNGDGSRYTPTAPVIASVLVTLTDDEEGPRLTLSPATIGAEGFNNGGTVTITLIPKSTTFFGAGKELPPIIDRPYINSEDAVAVTLDDNPTYMGIPNSQVRLNATGLGLITLSDHPAGLTIDAGRLLARQTNQESVHNIKNHRSVEIDLSYSGSAITANDQVTITVDSDLLRFAQSRESDRPSDLSATFTLEPPPAPAGITISETSLALTELGTSSAMEKTYTVVLDTDPTADVTITVTNGDATAVAVDTDADTTGHQNTMTFTAGGNGSGSGGGNGNWATAQTVTVQALNDPDALAETFNLTHTATATGSTAPYHGISIDPVGITTTDAGHGVVVSETSFSLLDSDEEATYTVALKSQPSGDVEISATSGVTGTATVSPATLTFTDSDWNTPQTVTVTGKGAGSTTISHEVSTTADTTNYPTSTTISPVAITVTADTRRTVNLENPGNTGTYGVYTVNEGETGQIHVILSGALGADVEIPVTLSGFARGTAEDYTEPNPSSVTIPAGQTRATLSIVTTDDNLVEGHEGVGIRIDTDHLPGTVRAGTTVANGFYIIDNDGLVPSIGTMALKELGGPGEVEKTYTIVLKTDPADANITVMVSSNKEAAARVKIGSGPFGRQATFTFTPGNSGNWNTDQTVTVQAVNDGDGDDERFGISHQLTVSGSDENHPYLGARSGNVVVTIKDAGHGVVVSETSFSLLDSDEEGTYTVALKSQPSGDVEISATSGVTGTATVSPATLTFTDSDWNTPQTVTVTGKGAGSTAISHEVSTTADTTNYPTSTTISPVAITVTADNRPTVNLENPGNTGLYGFYTVNEGETGQIHVILSGALGADVEIPVTLSGFARGTAEDYTEPNPSSVTIPAGQTRATLSIVTTDDNLVEGHEGVGIRIDTDHLPGTVRAGTTVANGFYIIDNDGLLPSIGTMALKELGGPGEVEKTYTIVLKTDPADANITVTVSSNKEAAARVKIGSGPFGRQATFTFTPGNSGNWNTAQTVTVRALNDGDSDDERFAITHSTSVIDENNPYLTARADNVVVTITDAGHGVVVSEASLSLLDNDEEATYTVVLKSQPSGDVAISATSGVTGTATVSPATLTFTNSTWDDPQTVTVTGKGAGSTSISHAVSTTADATNYPTSTTIPPVAVTVTAVAPSAGLTITETDGDTTVSEDGTTLTDTYTIALNTEPTHDVTVTVTAGAEAQVNKTGGTAGPEQTLTFTPSGAGIWSAAQTITVTGVDDNIDNTGDERTVSISHGATSSDPNYIITNAGTVSVTVTDDDTDGVTVSETTRTVSEDGGTATYTVALDTEPLSNVTITVTSDDDTMVKLDGPDNATAYTDTEDLVFAPSNWNTPQTVTIQGQNDNIFNSRTRTATITHKITAEGNGDGSRYTPTAPVIASVLVTLTDDEEGPRLTLSPATIGAEGFNNGGTVTITLIPKSTTFFGAGKELPPIIDRPYINSEDAVAVTLDDNPTYMGIPNSQVRLNATGLGLITLSDHPAGLTIDAGRLLARQTNQESVHNIKNHRSVEIDLSYSGSAITANDQVTITVDSDLLRFAQSRESDRPSDLSATFTLEPPPAPAGITISETSLALTELGTSSAMEKTYTVVLDTDPTADVTITVTNGDATAVAVDTDADTTGHQNTMTFTAGGNGSGSGTGNGNWATAQTVTVQALNDPDALAETFNLTHTATATGNTAPYDGITIDPVGITTTDAGHGVVVSETSFSLLDSDEEATYTVALKSQPSGAVEISATSGVTGTATVSPATLTFTDSDWNTPQTVTVTGKGAGSTSISHAVSTTADTTNYPTSTTISPVAITVTAAAPSAGLTITETDSDTTVSEDGTTLTDTYTIALNTEPTHNVTVTVTAGAEAQVNKTGGTAGSEQTLTFTPSSAGIWSTAQTITVTGVDDNIDNVGDERTATISHAANSMDNDYKISSAGSVTVTVTDDDESGISIAESDGATSVTETSGMSNTDTYTLALTSLPSHDVIAAISSPAAMATVSPASLTFTTTDWNTTQTVTVTGVDDNVDQSGNRTITITHTLSSSDTKYNSLSTDVTATLVDDDTAGATINEPDGSTSVTEATGAGRTDTYTVVLDTLPAAGVEIAVASGATAIATVSPSTLTFTTGNWNTAQTVTVTGVDDNVDQTGNRSATIRHTATSTDPKYNGVMISSVTVTVVDDDGAGVTINESDGSTSVTEATGAGRTDTYTVVLASLPSASVQIAVASGATGAATVSPATLTFATGNWNTTQTVTVTGVDDDVDNTDDARSATIRHTATSTDTGYSGIDIDDVIATVVDNDTASITITQSDGSTSVSEAAAGRTDTHTVKLATRPVNSVTIEVTSDDTGAATVSPATLTFTTGNWNTARTVTVTGVDDNVDQSSNRSATIRHTASSTDPKYNTLSSNVAATVVDDDTAGVTIDESGGISVTEAAGMTNTGSYTVVLDTLPTASVKIAVASGATAIATVSPATLTFTTGNWNTSQTVTVTGVDDNVDQSSNRSATISHTATSTDTGYSGIDIDDVTATVVDNDTAGATISPSGGISVTEAAGTTNTGSYTVVLDTLPAAGVEIAVASGATAIATVSPSTLTFTTGNWNTAQTVTVTGVDDNVDQTGNRSATISHTATSTDPKYNGVMISSVTVTVVDDDGAGVTINESDGSTSVTEATGAGRTDTYTVVLASLPSASVQIAVASGATGAATVSPATLTFTTGNWNTTQTVTVTGVDDNVDQTGNRSATIRHTATSTDPKYNGVMISSVTVTVVDDDGAGVTINESDGSTSVTEATGAGRTDTYTVVLASLPSASVQIAVASGATGAATVSPATLTFATGNWNTTQTVTVTGVDDDVDNTDDARSATIRHTATSTDTGYSGIDIDDVTATVVDNDTASITITQSDGSTSVSEAAAGRTDTHTVKLATRPVNSVTIEVTSDDTGAATVSPATLTFTTGNWNTARTVTVTGVDDNVDQSSNRSATIRHTASSTDPKYNTLSSNVAATVVDDDTAGVTIGESGGISVTEAAGTTNTGSYTVVLDTLPTASVKIAVASDATAIATVSPATLTFTTGNWNTAQTVTVTGVDDNVDQSSNRSATIRHTATSTDTGYSGIDIDDVTATVVDNDTAGATISPSGGISVTEAAGASNTGSYTVVLDTLPAAGVEIAVTSGATAIATVSPSTLTFTTGNWNTAQTVTVTGVDDNVDQTGNRSATISHTATSTDPKYNGVMISSVTVTVVDDDGAGVTINESDGSTSVTEATGAGRTDTYTVVLASLPSASVQIAVASGATGAATVSPATLTFTTGNWNTTQTVTVTGVDDNVDQTGNRSATIRHTATSTDPKYNGVMISSVTVTVVDDDGAGVTINESDGSTSVTEATGAGRTDTYTVVLASLPSASVQIAVASGATGAATVSPATLTFATGNWNTTQTVTVTGVDDDVDNTDDARSATIRHTATSTDTGYSGIDIDDVIATVVDNDTASITITQSDGSTSVSEAAAGRTDTHTVKLATRPVNSVTIEVTSDDTGAATVSPATLTFTTGNWNTARTVTVTGVDDNVDQSSNRSATIRHTASSTDPKYNTLSSNVAATVVDDDTAGVTIDESGGISVTEAAGTTNTGSYTVVLDTLPTASVKIAVASDATAIATVSPATLIFTTGNWNTSQTVTVTGVDDNVDQSSNRSATISHTATSTDTGYSGIDIDDVTATVVDDDGVGVTINESDGSTSVTEATGAARTDTYTMVLGSLPSASVEIAVVSGNTGAATVSPATLTFTTGNWNTAQTVTVTGVDDTVDQTGNRSATIRHTATSTDTGYSGIDIDDVTVTVVDDDGVGVTINESDGSTSVTEATGAARTDTYTVVLGSLPSASVEIAVVSGNTGAATVSPATLTFTTGNWNTAQTVTVTGVDDDVDNTDDARSATIRHTATSSDTDYSGIDIDDVTATVVDNDTASITIIQSDGSTSVSEAAAGRTDTYTVKLATQPVRSVTIEVTSGDTGAAMVSPATLTFTTGNWNTAQTVTVTGVDDDVDQSSNRSATIRHTASSTDPKYNTLSANVAATVVDDDTAGVTIGGSGSVSITEAAGTTNIGSYTVVLNTQPIRSVTIEVTSGATGAATVNPATLTFTTSNWNTPQTVTVTGVDDSVDQSNNRSVTISHTPTSIDPKYSNISIANVTATVVDNDDTAPPSMPAVQFGAADYSGGEASGSRTVNVALSATPAFTAATTISYTVSGTATAGEDFTPLTGTVSMAGGAGSVPITILDDQIDDDGETILLTLTAASDYTVGPQGSAIITITDDDGVTLPTPALPVVSITGGGGVTEGKEASFTVMAIPAPPKGDTISVNVMISGSGDFTASGQIGARSITIDDSGIARFTVSTEDDITHEDDGAITATVQEGSGYTSYDSNGSASITVEDNDPALLASVSNLKVTEGGSTFYTIALDTRPPLGDVTVTTSVSAGEGTALTPNPNLSEAVDAGAAISVHPMTLTFTPANWDIPQRVNLTLSENSDVNGASITLTHTASGGGYPSAVPPKNVMVTVVAADPVEEKAAWHLRFGRTLSHQVVDALQDRLSAPPPVVGLELTVAGETITSATPLAEQEGALAKALGFNPVTSEALVEGSSFSFAPEQEGEDPHLAFWGQGVLSSFEGQEDALSLDGDVTTLLLGADWNAERWQAGAALSQSWGSGSYDGNNGAEGEISSTVTGLFPYGRYALTPRLGLWATVGYGWGQLFLKPDGAEDEDKPDATMGMAAIGMDGVLLDGGRRGITLSTNADVLAVKTASEEGDGLESSEGNISRHRIGLEAARPFPLAHGAFLLSSMEMGIRHDSGDAESGYGLDLGAGILWSDPGQGISGTLKGHTLLTHGEESLQEQGLSLSFSWEPSPSNRGPSLSVSHAMGAIASGGMDALLNPTTFEGLDANPGSGQQQFEAELAYGFPAHNDHVTLTPALALALSPTSRNYSLLWSLAPYSDQEQGQADPWELSLAGEWQEKNGVTSPVEHSLKLRFSLLF